LFSTRLQIYVDNFWDISSKAVVYQAKEYSVFVSVAKKL